MKNKNSVFIFIAATIAFSLAKIYFVKDFKVPREKIIVSDKEASLPQSDLKKIESFLKPQNIQSPNWETLVDYRTDLKKTINKENAKSYFETASKNLPDLVICLRKDFCGMDKPTVESPYFDSERTPAHLLVARTLKVILESLKNRPDLAAQVDWNLITEISGLSGNEVKEASMNLLVNFDRRNAGKDNLFEIAASYKGTAKASFYSQVAAELLPEERPIFVNTLEKSFEQDDPNTVISIVDRIQSLHLSDSEVASVGKALCHFKDGYKHNWDMIVLKMKVVDTNFEQNCL